jgi:hypothetical protein
MPFQSRIMVCGSRGWTDEQAIADVLILLASDTVVMLGGAKGADAIALRIAKFLPLSILMYLPAWDVEGKRAGILRNLRMLDDHPDEIHAFWDGKSRGTRHVIDEATRRGYVAGDNLHVHQEEVLSLFG